MRIHTGERAAALNGALDALAFTYGRDVHFGSGAYRPETRTGKRLLAHELTHVVQQSAAGTPVLQRQRKRGAGSRRAVVSVRWTEDRVEFYHRLVAAIARRAHVSEASLWAPLHAPTEQLHMRLSRGTTVREGRPVRVIADLVVDPDRVPAVRAAQLEPEGTSQRSEPESEPEATRGPAPKPSEGPRPGETPEQRLRRQAATTVRVLSTTVADADREGYSGVELTVKHTGSELAPGFEKKGPRDSRPSGTVPVSAETIAREDLRPHLEMILMSGQGEYRIVFDRDERGRMTFRRFERVEPRQTLSEHEALEALDIPDRRRIYREIFEQTEAELKEIGIQVAGFTVEQLVLWVVGGLFLRAFRLVASGAAHGFPYLRRAIQGRRTGDIAKAVNSLGEAEAAEFATLMRQVQRGRLSRAQRSRLSELMARVEAVLGQAVSRNIAGTQGLLHSFDRHAAQWFGRPVSRTTHLAEWQALIERAAQSTKTVPWSVGSQATIAHHARIEGKHFVVQFYTSGPRAGELATAFVPTQRQLTEIFRRFR